MGAGATLHTPFTATKSSNITSPAIDASCLTIQAAEKRIDPQNGRNSWFLREGYEAEYRVRMNAFAESEWFGYLLTCIRSCRCAPGTDCYSCVALSFAGNVRARGGGVKVERQSKARPSEQAKKRGEMRKREQVQGL